MTHITAMEMLEEHEKLREFMEAQITELYIKRILTVATPLVDEWLATLPLYPCPTCGKETIFQKGCVECDE